MDFCQLIRKEIKMGVAQFDQKQLATRWRFSEATLERWRSEGLGFKFLKLCGRVHYRQVDIEAYEEFAKIGVFQGPRRRSKSAGTLGKPRKQEAGEKKPTG